jgi:hypothetical protein
MAGAAKATTKATARKSFFMVVLLVGVGLVMFAPTGWPFVRSNKG